MSTLDRYRIVKLTPELQQQFGLPARICADPTGMPFPEGHAFHQWLVDENACEPSTARNYLMLVLPFLTYLHRTDPLCHYTAPAEQIRQHIRAYLKAKLGCVVRPHRGGNYTIPSAKVATLSTVRLLLTALKRFYTCAILKGWYADANPLMWTSRLAVELREFKPQMPPASGLTLPEHKRGRVPDTYFCVVNDHWQPQIIDEPNLPKQLLVGFTRLRDQLITRILFESGARVGEVLALTVGDWRQREQRERALATNKGSGDARVKELWWSSSTAQWLRRYVNEERRRCDPFTRGWDELSDETRLFVTDAGRPYTYAAFYVHWCNACQRVGLKVTPHQARHWFVTMALHKFESLPSQQRDAARQSLIAYMSWRNPQTIQAYDHHVRRMDFAATHAALVQLVESGQTRSASLPAAAAGAEPDVAGIPEAMWERLSAWLANSEEAP